MSKGGEVFVLNMGEPVKIADLARKMIHLMGLSQKTAENPVGDVPVVYVGLRPGEKLYEELLIGNNPQPTLHPRILMAREESLSWPRLEVLLTALVSASQSFDCQKVVDILGKAPTGYSPDGQVKDALWSRISDNAGQRSPGLAVPRSNARIASANVYKFPV
jgi:FlaA1/EpsC-like NDP-sugar epimerase